MNPATLRERLREIVGTTNKPAGVAAAPAPSSSAGSVATPFDDRHHGSALEDLLDGAWRDDETGRSFVVRRRVSPATPYGRFRVGDFSDALTEATDAVRLVGGADVAGPFVFFDLETTGLSGGAGTYVFIVGCGWFDEVGGFITEQHLLVDYGTERAMLRRVARDLSRAGAFVTFNGKSFDAPVIETRYLFHRMTSPCSERPHVDLIHPSRRFWSGLAAEGCSLGALEDALLGATREGDVSGFEIPARYFRFVHTGDPRPLAAVLEHNRLDLLSLAGLTAHLCRLVDAGPEATQHPQEALALGRVYERAGLAERAEAAFEHAAARCAKEGARPFSPGETAMREAHIDALRALALAARRQRRYERAAEWWRKLLEVSYCPRRIAIEATEALAIHHEHRVRDLAAAKIFALKALEEVAEAPRGDAVRHRLARIERKIVSAPKRPIPSSPLLPSFDSPMSAPRTSS
jgi:uncharacterized protein YprB with RNaseH-like and TPR domain